MAEVAGGGNNTATRVYCTKYVAADAGRRTATEESRERRRRRIQLRRRNAALGGGGGSAAVDGGEEMRQQVGMGIMGSTVMGFPVQQAGFPWAARQGDGGFFAMQRGGGGGGGPTVMRVQVPVADMEVPMGNRVPVVGGVAIPGRQRTMEDTVMIKTDLCSPAMNRYRPVHYFGVFDGHGGPHFSEMCKENMHEMVEEELTRISMGGRMDTNKWSPAPPPLELIADESLLQEAWRLVMIRSFIRTELVALHTCICGSVGFICKCELSCGVTYAGTTAVAVVLTDHHIVVGNCGDSRAVLYRGGRVIPLTFDHKPDRADEKARIQAMGGRIINADIPRVQGILAMSRALGDRYLKPYVISEPEVTFTRRDGEDEFLIIATDGLWDVLTAKFAGRVTRHCLFDKKKAADAVDGGGGYGDQGFVAAAPQSEGTSAGASGGGDTGSPSRSACAAALLTRLALAKRSHDNISVVVVDLKRSVVGGGDDN
ncbi:hypothetical protein ABFS83_01G052200 [Erythranthe nasuta]